MTYGSTSVANAFTPFRKVGAAARAVLMKSLDSACNMDARVILVIGANVKSASVVIGSAS